MNPHETDPGFGRFSDRAGDYAKRRPGYPDEGISFILDGMGPAESLRAADVGAGTGISARLVADRGVLVSAVEPNKAMRDTATPHDRVEWFNGSAESVPLLDESLDLVLCAQAYHWFDPKSACAEFARVLRPGGRLVLMWNEGDQSVPVVGAYYETLKKASGLEELPHTAARRLPEVAPPFALPDRVSFKYSQAFDREGLIGRALSASYAPKEGPAHELMINELRDIHDRHADEAGLIEFVYDTLIYTTHKPA